MSGYSYYNCSHTDNCKKFYQIHLFPIEKRLSKREGNMYKYERSEIVFENTARLDSHLAIGNTAFIRGNYKAAAGNYHDALDLYYQANAVERLKMEKLRDNLNWQKKRQEIIFEWINTHPNGPTPGPYKALGGNDPSYGEIVNKILKIFIHEMLDEDKWIDVYNYIFEELLRLDIEISSPGNSVERKIAVAILQLYGKIEIDQWSLINIPSIRIGIDLLEQEFRNRWIIC